MEARLLALGHCVSGGHHFTTSGKCGVQAPPQSKIYSVKALFFNALKVQNHKIFDPVFYYKFIPLKKAKIISQRFSISRVRLVGVVVDNADTVGKLFYF